MIEKLHSVGVFSLQDIRIPVTSVLEQARLSTDYIGLVEHEDVSVWNGYSSLLKASHVILSNVNDKLVWNLSKSGIYSPKEGYLHLLDRSELEFSWWWKVLWKLKCPIKAKKNCWFLFSNKALTWDVLVKKGREGPGRCSLCKLEAESNFHLGVS